MLVSICCIACYIGDQTWYWSRIDPNACVLSLLEFDWCFRFTWCALCSSSILVKEEDFTHWEWSLGCMWIHKANGHHLSLEETGDQKALEIKGKGWSVVEAQSMRCCAPDLKAHWGSLRVWTHTQSKLEEQSEPPDDPVAQWPVLLKVITSWSWSDSAEVEGRRRSLNKACEVLGELAEVSPQWNDDVVEVQASSPKEMEVLSTRLIMELSCAHQQA